MPHQPRRHHTWSRPLATLVDAFRRNPRRTLELLPKTDLFDKRALRRLSLAIHGRDVLADIYAAAAEVGAKPFLMWGTLLGAIREGRLMAHDYDVDIGLLPADYARRDALIGALIARGYLYVEDARYKFRLLRRDHLLHIDFELFYPAGDRMICLAGTEHDGYFGAQFPAGLFAPPRPLTILDGIEVLMPADPEAVLATIYGPGWRVPDPHYKSSADLGNRLIYAPGEPIPLPPEA